MTQKYYFWASNASAPALTLIVNTDDETMQLYAACTCPDHSKGKQKSRKYILNEIARLQRGGFTLTHNNTQYGFNI